MDHIIHIEVQAWMAAYFAETAMLRLSLKRAAYFCDFEPETVDEGGEA